MGPKELAQKTASYFKKTKSFEYVSPVRSARDGYRFSTDARPYYYVELEFKPAGIRGTEHYEIRFLKFPETGWRDERFLVKGSHGGMVSEMEDAVREIERG
jgi:hypothetical protein